MGESKRRHAWEERVRGGAEECVYCGDCSETVEHVPARSIFIRRDRPPGMEYPACYACNHGTSKFDHIAAFVVRIQVDDLSEIEMEEWQRYAQAMVKDFPGLVDSMNVPRGAEKLAVSQAGLPRYLRMVRIPDVVHKAMLVTGAKLGFAVHSDVTGGRVPNDGGVVTLWASNQHTLAGFSFQEIDDFLGPLRVLSKVRKSTSGQFSYQVLSSVEGYVVTKAHWRKSGAVTLSIAGSGGYFQRWASQKFEISHLIRTGELKTLSAT